MSTMLTLYTHPRSRGRIARWMLEEIGEPYDTVVVPYGPPMKAPEYLALNPMGKVPTLVHGDTVVTETPAILAYLADAFPAAGLAPPLAERGAYYRWLFFAAGPMEAAVTDQALGLQVAPEKQGFVGYGSAQLTEDTLAAALAGRTFIAGDRFSAADLYLCAKLDFALAFGNLPKRPEFLAYCAAHAERPAKRRAAALDDAAVSS
ncbi:MAG: glutathione S-transferase family protein [Betaproteobacteria bacterium]|jgi:glutathione S-transferase|nr:glutathione S-transferase family protein [Betaproteobacteria bacterium]